MTGGGVDISVKNSWDVGISHDTAWSDAVAMLNSAVLDGFVRYIRKYPYTLLAPASLVVRHPRTGEQIFLKPERLRSLRDSTLSTLLLRVFDFGTINLQKYIADEGGYPHWHCEAHPNWGSGNALSRALLWTIYLNEEFEEGET